MLEQRFSDNDVSKRDIPSFIEPRPPLIQNPFMRPRPQKGTNLLELFEEDSEIDEPELVQVYLRLKPCKVPNTLYEVRSDRCLVTSLDTATAGHGRRTQHNVSKMYTFSKIFGAECNQREIFEAVVKDNLKKLPDGQNFTLLTYGASGSGKTYTLMGTVGAPGLVPRSLEYVFRLVEAAQQPAFKPAENGAEKLNCVEQEYELQWVKRLRHVSAPLRDKYRRMSVQLHSDLTVSSIDLSNRIRHYVWVSFVEIYNEAIYDLLAPPEKRAKLRIREDSSGNVYVKGATQAFVRSGEEAYDVMVAGKHNLVVAATGVHAHSSRSHCIFTITMLTETGAGEVRTSAVRLCDLAGCERARATRNTGARMAESRAINSSLHVLERCLHMLRRKQRARGDAMVPYRESKLTRLLGSGLSGARGEAVSMVVTLNPSPEYAHETKHVLTLAAVAQDIQINNTMLTTTLDSNTVDTTISCSAEVMQLRADNERLHFELVQAQARNKELMAAMETRQQESANTMRELVEEAKDITKQYYEAQLEALRCEMDDMIEEYESRLSKQSAPAPSTTAGTPSRFLQAKVAELMTEIAVLEEKLTAERLARSRAEKEVQHLRTCIEERDEKAFKDSSPPREDVMSLSDSEHESDEEKSDPFNESLEPIFKKELNRSLAIQNEKHDSLSVHTIDNIEEECHDDIEKSHDTIKVGDDSKNSAYDTGEDDINISGKIDATNDDVSESLDESLKPETNYTFNTEKKQENLPIDSAIICDKYTDSFKEECISKMTYNNNDDSLKNDSQDYGVNDLSVNSIVQFKNETFKSGKFDLRGTYFVGDSKVHDESDSSEDKEKEVNSLTRGTYFVKDPLTEVSKSHETCEEIEVVPAVFKAPVMKEKSKIDIIVPETVKNTTVKERSYVDMEIREKVSETVINKMVKEKSNMEMPEIIRTEDLVNELMTEKSNADMKITENVSNTIKKIVREKSDMKTLDNSSDNLVKEKSYVDPKHPEKISDSIINKPENDLKILDQAPITLVKEKSNTDIKVPEKVSEALVNKIFRSLKSNQERDNSLRQFEQLEQASKDCKDDIEQNQSVFGNIKMLKEKRTYFDDVSTNDIALKQTNENAPILVKEKKTYFDNIKVNADLCHKRVNEINKYDDERSPSIVKDIVVSDNFEPSTIKKLLGESFTKADVISSMHKTQLNKKHNSVDIFEGFDSPLGPKTPKPKEKTDNVEIARQSIEKLVLDQQSAKKVVQANHDAKLTIREDLEPPNDEVQIKVKKEMKLEPMSSVEESNDMKVIKKETKSEKVSFTEEPKQTTSEVQTNDKQDNTIEEFENIYKDITAPRTTEFELLVSQEVNDRDEKNGKAEDEIKYNLRRKQSKNEDTKFYTAKGEEILAESQAKCESKIRKRPLRLRRRKNQDEETDDKLKDIVNLQSEFSDVTLDVPAPQKMVKDIPSPEKEAEENLPPRMGIQSCPSKSVTRSRRKLFTPRAEPLEESLSQTGDSNERIYVPRPSYHRPRARRKL